MNRICVQLFWEGGVPNYDSCLLSIKSLAVNVDKSCWILPAKKLKGSKVSK